MKPGLVLVFLNGQSRYVPRLPASYFAFRGALGVQRGLAVMRYGSRTTIAPTDFQGEPWAFVDGERFTTIGIQAVGGLRGHPEPDDLEPWEKPEGWWKGTG